MELPAHWQDGLISPPPLSLQPNGCWAAALVRGGRPHQGLWTHHFLRHHPVQHHLHHQPHFLWHHLNHTLPSWCGSLSCLLLGLLLFPINQGKVEVNVEPLKYVWYYQCWSLHFSGLTENKPERCLALSVVCFEVYCIPDDGAWTKIGFTPFWGKCLSFSCSRSTPLKIDQRG